MKKKHQINVPFLHLSILLLSSVTSWKLKGERFYWMCIYFINSLLILRTTRSYSEDEGAKLPGW